ncbi:TPA: response regulator, partial [Enterococcus faecium]|nr:response regulator [Enterococcus faecium]
FCYIPKNGHSVQNKALNKNSRSPIH